MRIGLVGFTALGLGLVATGAHARNRPLFEPTDLEMEKSGMVEIDTQLGVVRGEGPMRLVIPDVEIDIGFSRNVELDIDATYAIEGPDDGRFSFDHAAPDNIWLAAKLGLYDSREADDGTAWAIGAQLGHKLPVANDAHGIGYGALLLAGHTWGESHLVVNVGGLVDPGAGVSTGRPISVDGGLDLDLHFGKSPVSITGEFAAVHFFSPDTDQLNMTGGVTYGVSDDLDLSIVGLVGFLGGDRAGLLFGISPKFALWK